MKIKKPHPRAPKTSKKAANRKVVTKEAAEKSTSRSRFNSESCDIDHLLAKFFELLDFGNFAAGRVLRGLCAHALIRPGFERVAQQGSAPE